MGKDQDIVYLPLRPPSTRHSVYYSTYHFLGYSVDHPNRHHPIYNSTYILSSALSTSFTRTASSFESACYQVTICSRVGPWHPPAQFPNNDQHFLPWTSVAFSVKQPHFTESFRNLAFSRSSIGYMADEAIYPLLHFSVVSSFFIYSSLFKCVSPAQFFSGWSRNPCPLLYFF
jgi:hypothetical protein